MKNISSAVLKASVIIGLLLSGLSGFAANESSEGATKNVTAPQGASEKPETSAAQVEPEASAVKKPDVAPLLSKIKGTVDKPGTYTFDLKVGNITRYYILHIPKNYKKKKAAPLVLALHTGGGSMNIQAQDDYYGLVSKSDKEGFLVAFPNGYSTRVSGSSATWNAGECCGKARDKKIDDVAFIKDVIKKLKTQVSVDDKKVFAVGMSNGGMMAYRLACEAPGLFKGIASVSGTDATVDCKPSQAVSILHIHAKDDGSVPFNGGLANGKKNNKAKSKAQGKKTAKAGTDSDFKSVSSIMTKWRGLYSCMPDPMKVMESEKASCKLYQGCMGGANIQLCVTETGGHTWPGSKVSPIKGRSPSQALNATDIIWDFFK